MNSMVRTWLARAVGVCFFAVLARADAPAQAPSLDEVQVTADKLDYLTSGEVYASGNVVVVYQDLTVYSDEVTYNDATGIVESPGWTRVTYKNLDVIGEKVVFNVRTRAGQFENAHAIADLGNFKHEGRWYERKWYAYARKVTKDPHENSFHMEGGKVTTCPPEYQHPLYWIEAKHVSLLPPEPDDPDSTGRIVARNGFVKLEGIPLLWLPYMTYTIREDDRQSPVQVMVGYSSRKGVFAVAALDVFRNQNLRITPHIDFYSKHGIGFGVDGSYYYRATNITTLSGNWKTFFLEDMSKQFIHGMDKKKGDEKDTPFRYRFLWEHTQTFGPGAGWLNNAKMMWDVNLLSDNDLMQDFYYDENTTHGQRDTWFDITKPIGEDNEVSLYAVKQINSFYTTYERLPELRHVFRKREILRIPALDVPVYYESKTRAGWYRFVESDDISGHTSYSLWKAWTDHKISAPKRFFGFLNFEPFMGVASEFGSVSSYKTGISPDWKWRRRVWAYSERTPPIFWQFDYNRFSRVPINVYTEQSDGGIFHMLPYGGLDMSFKLHRTYDMEGTYAGQLLRRYLSSDNEKVRHIIEPKARVIGTPGFGTDSGLAAGSDLGLRNAFQIVRNGRNADLLDFTFYHSARALTGDLFEEQTVARKYRRYRRWGFRPYEEEKMYAATHAFGFDWNASPLEWLDVEGDAVWDLDKYNRFTIANVRTHADVSWAVQRLFASPYMIRSLRGRKDEVILDFGYRYLYDQANLISAGGRVWFDDFTPLLSEKMRQKTWAREWTRGWGAGVNVRFEAKSGTLQEVEYSLYKNWKKCLDTELTYRRRDGEDTIMATFWLTAYPGAKLETGSP